MNLLIYYSSLFLLECASAFLRTCMPSWLTLSRSLSYAWACYFAFWALLLAPLLYYSYHSCMLQLTPCPQGDALLGGLSNLPKTFRQDEGLSIGPARDASALYPKEWFCEPK